MTTTGEPSGVSVDARAARSAAAGHVTPWSLDGYEEAARATLPRAVYDYFAGGAENEVTLRGNRAAYERYYLRPRVMVDVSHVDASVEVLGDRLAFPVALAPAAFQ